MPLYEYVCLDCHRKLERLRSMEEADARIECVACGSDRTRRALSLFFAHGRAKPETTTVGGCACGGSCHCRN